MAKRFTDTEKYKKPFIRGLQGAYKLLWDYLYHDCDHAGIWIVDFDIAQIYIGHDMPVNREDALKYFNEGEVRVIELRGGKKWFIRPFIDFQYGELNPNNRVHKSVINALKKEGVLKTDKGLASPLEGCKDKDMDKDMDMDKDKECAEIKIQPEESEFNPGVIPPPKSVDKVIEIGAMKGVPPDHCEVYFEMRNTDNFLRKDRNGQWKQIPNWHADLFHCYKKGYLESEHKKTKNHHGQQQPINTEKLRRQIEQLEKSQNVQDFSS